MSLRGWSAAAAVGIAACLGTPPPQAPTPAASPVRPADVELAEASTAVVHGSRIAFDGEAEGLSWPNLERALARKPGDTGELTLGVARTTRMRDVLRVVWTLRAADLRIQTPDTAGGVRTIVLRAKPATPTPGCHVALFAGDKGSLRVASASGSKTEAGPDAVAKVVQSVDAARAQCPLRYVAFGSETNDAAWGPVFDLAVAVDDAKAAGQARYVLGEAIHTEKP